MTNIAIATKNGNHYGIVFQDGREAFRTPGYLTEVMALAAAKCWTAFHGDGIMDIVQDTDTFESRSKGDQRVVISSAQQMRATIANAEKHGVSVSVMTGEGGRKYINIHNGGSSYGRYFYAAS
jgi:hypothetical protein